MAGILLALLAAGCLADGRTTETGSGDVTGTWVLTTSDTCQQTLMLGPGGIFWLAARLRDMDATTPTALRGTYSGSPVTDSDGTTLIQLQPSEPWPQSQPLYCEQWEAQHPQPLPFAEVASARGVDPEALVYRMEAMPGRGNLLVGSDDAQTDRFALFLDKEGQLRGTLLDDHTQPNPLYFLTPDGWEMDARNRWDFKLYHLPYINYIWDITPAGWRRKMLLNITMALDITLGTPPDSPLPFCKFSVFEAGGTVVRAEDILAGAKPGTSIFVNPFQPHPWLIKDSLILSDTISFTRWLLFLAAESRDMDDCGNWIKARPAVVRVVTEREARGVAFPLRIPVAGSQPFLIGDDPHNPGHPLRLSLTGGMITWDGLKVKPQLYQTTSVLPGTEGVPADQDFLNLLGTRPGPVEMRMSRTGSGEFLGVYTEAEAVAGKGPFQRGGDTADTVREISLPMVLNEVFATGESRRIYRFTLEKETRIAVRTGGDHTQGTLLDETGWPLANDRNGALDGMGFEIRRTLPAGRYDVVVTAAQTPAAFSLVLEEPAEAPQVVDEGLEACLLANGLTRLSSAPALTRLICSNYGVERLDGLESFPCIKVLDLRGNHIQSLAPLGQMLLLRSLDLSGNPVGDLTVLRDILGYHLHRLSLAHTRLSPEQLEVLEMMNWLGYLDLSGAEGVTPEALARLKRKLYTTIVVAPDGSIMD